MRSRMVVSLFVSVIMALVFLAGCDLLDLVRGGTIGGAIKSVTVSFSVRGTALFTTASNPAGENRDVGVATEIRSTDSALVEYDATTHTLNAYADPSDKTALDMQVVFDANDTQVLSVLAQKTVDAAGWTSHYFVSGEDFASLNGNTLYGAEGTSPCSGHQLGVFYTSTSNAGADVGQYLLQSHYCESSSYVRITIER